MKTISVVLLILGLIVETLGFVIDKSDAFHFVNPLVAPDYIHGMASVDKMRKQQPILPEDEGFNILAGVVMDILRNNYDSQTIDGISVTKFEAPQPAGLKLGKKKGTRFEQSLFVYLTNGQKMPWNVEALILKLEELRKTRFTNVSICIFIAGILLQIVGFVMERNNKKDNEVITSQCIGMRDS